MIGYHNSREINSVLAYRDNDITHGMVNAKPYSRCGSVSKIDFNEAR